MHPIIKMVRLLTHINIGATIALLAWLATFFPFQDSGLSASPRPTALVAEGGVR